MGLYRLLGILKLECLLLSKNSKKKMILKR